MKYYTPKLATAILASAAMLGAAGSRRPLFDIFDMAFSSPRVRGCRSKGRVAQNQRQRRLDRRRAWAAGNRRAFR